MPQPPAHYLSSGRRPPATTQGAALVLTLVLLSLMAIIAVALAVGMRTDRTSARYFLDHAKAAMFEDQGVNHAASLLRTLCGSTNYAWAVQPGQGYASTSTTSKTLSISVPLNSGLGTQADDPNLNLASFTSQGYRIVNPANVAMKVKWIYVRQNGALDTTTSLALSNSNPIVGRYGFWVDPESSRVNWNTAYKRDSTKTQTLSPDNIDLAALDGISANPAIADQIHAFVQGTRFFNSPSEVRAANTANDSNFLTAVNTNRFTTTYWSHDPEQTYWGAPRIVLTTRQKLAGGKPFIDILKQPDTGDPGLLDNIDLYTKLPQAVKLVADYLARTDWPVGPSGSSFGSKFFDTASYPNPTQARQYLATQLAIHIIDYVRAKESTESMVQRLTGMLDSSGNFYRSWWDSSTDLSSHSRQVHITEMGAYVDPNPAPVVPADPFRYNGQIFLEIHLPRNYGLAAYDLSNLAVQVIWNISWYDSNNKLGTPLGLDTTNTKINGLPATSLPAGGYAVVTVPFTYNPSQRYPWSVPSRPSRLYLKAYLLPKTNLDPAYNIDAAPIITGYYDGNTGIIPYDVDLSATLPNAITTVETDDPRINGDCRDWKRRATGNSLGAVNSASTLGGSPSPSVYTQAPQDTNTSGLLTDDGLTMPPPAGKTGNLDGIVHSVAELGCVLTGSQGEYGSGTQPRSVSWRSLRFQPTKANSLPDWALLDLFTVPLNTTNRNTALAFTSTTSNSIHGRINLNGLIEPFEPTLSLARITPLAALLKGLSFPGGSTHLDIAQNIYNRVLAGDVTQYKGHSKIYTLRGEIAEVKGLSDTGESTELRLQDIVDLATTQSNVFRVYSVGQSILQSKDGRYVSTGESRGCTFIERQVTTSGNVSFHLIYHQDINF